MDLQTKIPLSSQQQNQIDYNSNILLLGSCFSENIGEKFNYFKLQSVVNPIGILFHPVAIENFITRVINRDYYSEVDIQFHNEQWFCLDAHSKLNSSSKVELLKHLNQQRDISNKQLREASHIVITLGTSWVYRHISADAIVANCHKLPQKQFLKELLTINEIRESLEAIIAVIRSVNTKVNFIFTVSPVRHIKDGFVENTQSKSHLLAAIHQLIDPKKQLFYFPSYELMMDELRDYRFYNADMLHPNEIAVNYIWEKFKYVWLSGAATETSNDILTIQKGLRHKPFNSTSEAHQKFLKDLEIKMKEVKTKFSHIVF